MDKPWSDGDDHSVFQTPATRYAAHRDTPVLAREEVGRRVIPTPSATAVVPGLWANVSGGVTVTCPRGPACDAGSVCVCVCFFLSPCHFVLAFWIYFIIINKF